MPNTVQLKRSSTANSVPSAGNLVAGELAINYTDGNLFYKNASNVVTVIASNKFSSVTGNVDAGNIRTTGLISATGNITGGNVIAGAGSGGSITGAVLISASGNIIGGALLTAGITSATGNITGGNVLTGGVISATGNGVIAGRQLTVGAAYTTFAAAGRGIVAINGTTALLEFASGTANYGYLYHSGSAGNLSLWNSQNGCVSIATNNTERLNISSAGVVSATANVIGGNLLTGGLVSATGNVTGGNILTTGLFSVTGNVTANNGIFTNIVNVASHTGAVVSVTGNVTGGNLRTGGLISATGAIIGAAITGSSLTVSTGNVTAGNLILSGTIIDSTQLDIQTSAANANIVFTPNGTGIVGVSTALSVTGNITGGNLLTGGLISAAGNIIGGNLGVGATPSNKLYVYSTVNANAATTQANFVDDGSTGGTLYQHRIVVQGKSGAGSIDIGTTDATTAHFNNQACTFITAGTLPLMLWQSAAQPIIFATNGSEKVRITSTGVLSVGTSGAVLADGNFVVAGSNGTGQGTANTVAQANFWETTSGNNSGIWIGSMTDQTTAVIGSRTATGNIAFQTYNGGWGERARITYDGNFGLGVIPSSIQTGYKAIQIGATVGGGIVSAGTDTYFTNNFYVTGGTWYTGSTGYGSYYNQSAGAHNWSISTTAGAAGAKSLSTQMTLDAGANLSVVGDVIGYASSDKKFKTNIRPIPNALSAVEYIGGKLFDWTDEYMESVGHADGYFRQKEDFGIVAQDVQKVFPLAVRTRPDGSLAVDYVKLSALAFASIAELSAKLKDLEGKINDLTSRT